MKRLALLLAVVAVVCMVADVSMAKDKPEKGKGKGKRGPALRGVICQVEDGLQMKTRVKGEKKPVVKPIETNAETKVLIGKEEKTVGDLKIGMRVMITPIEGPAKLIRVAPPREKKPKDPNAPKKPRKKKPK